MPTDRSKQRKGFTWGEEDDEKSKCMSVDYDIGGTPSRPMPWTPELIEQPLGDLPAGADRLLP